MNQRIAHISLVVKDYDEAIQFYTEKLKCELLENTRLYEHKRWVLVAGYFGSFWLVPPIPFQSVPLKENK